MPPLSPTLITALTIGAGILSFICAVVYCAIKRPHTSKVLISTMVTYVISIAPLVAIIYNILAEVAGSLAKEGLTMGLPFKEYDYSDGVTGNINATILVFSLGYALIQITYDMVETIKNRGNNNGQS